MDTNYLDRIEEIGDAGVYCLVGLGLAELERRKMKDKITMYRLNIRYMTSVRRGPLTKI